MHSDNKPWKIFAKVFRFLVLSLLVYIKSYHLWSILYFFFFDPDQVVEINKHIPKALINAKLICASIIFATLIFADFAHICQNQRCKKFLKSAIRIPQTLVLQKVFKVGDLQILVLQHFFKTQYQRMSCHILG